MGTPFASMESKIALNLRLLDSVGYLGPGTTGLSDPNLQAILQGFCNTLAVPSNVTVGILNSDKQIIDVPSNAYPMTMYTVYRKVTQQIGMPPGPPYDSFIAALCADVQAEMAADLAQMAVQQTRSPWQLLYYYYLRWMPAPYNDVPAPLVTVPPIDDPAVLPPPSVILPVNVWKGAWVMAYGKAVYVSYVPPS